MPPITPTREGRAVLREQPRERLRTVGVRNLSLNELLVLLLGSGGRSASVWTVALRLEERLGSGAAALAAADVSSLERVPGIGRAGAGRIVAAVELGRRVASSGSEGARTIRGPADVFHRMGPRLRDLAQEEFHVLLLNTRHRVIREVMVSRGTVDASLIHPREVFREAVRESASGVILVHNHPSGDATPSQEDHEVTIRLQKAGRTLGIPVLDHVVIGRGHYISLGGDLSER